MTKIPRCRCTEESLEKYGMHLLALSHVYLVPQLKQRCTKDLAQRLTIENVVDVLQLARLCDAPDLSLKCMKLVSKHFKAVEATEGWRFMQDHDPWLELDILQFIDETESVIITTMPFFFFSFLKYKSTNNVFFVSNYCYRKAEEKEGKKAQGSTELVFTAQRGHGVFGTHLHGRLHQRWAVRRGALQEEGSLQQVLHVPRPPALDWPFRHV